MDFPHKRRESRDARANISRAVIGASRKLGNFEIPSLTRYVALHIGCWRQSVLSSDWKRHGVVTRSTKLYCRALCKLHFEMNSLEIIFELINAKTLKNF